MKNKFSKFINLQGKYLTSLLLLLTFAIGNVRAAGTAIASLNFNEPTTLPSAYTYSSTNTPAIATFQSLSCINVSPSGGSSAPTFSGDNSAAPTGGKRWLAFQPAEDCSVTIKVGKANDTRTFYVLDKDHSTTSSSVSSYNPSAKNVWENLWVVNLKGGTWYAIIGSGSNCYIAAMSFVGAAKTDPTITFNDGAYTVGGSALDLSSLFSSNSDGAVTYTVKTDDGTSASISGTSFSALAAGTAVVTASQAATSSYNAATKDANIVVSVPSTPTHNISYTNTKGASTSALPTTYYEGTGIASFDPLADVTDFHFTGWSPASIAADATTDQTIDAQWVAAYNVTFNAGAGSGTVPASFQKWEGGKFNLPGQGSMTHATKVFDGWKANGAGDKLAADAEYTMGNAAVEFVAQWKAAPVTIFHWKSNTGTITIDAANGTTTGGTTTLRTTDPSKSWGNESVTYNASVAADMKGETSGKELKPGGNANYLELTLTSGTFQEGDVIYVTGYNNWAFLTSAEGISSATSFDVANVETGSGKGDAVTGSATIPAGIDAATIYARRANGSSSGIAAIKVTRIVKDIISTVNTLTDVKVGESSISAADLATLVSEHSLALSDALASAPTITFNKHTVVTYDDASTKTTDTPIDVTASDNGAGKWTASTTIDEVTYTVTLDIATGFAVTYNANGGTGTMTDATLYAAGDEVTILENTFTSPAANKKFNGWTSSPSVTITDGKFTMPSSAVELSAVWTEFFTVTYMDESATLGTEDVFVGSTPAGIAPTKPLFTFAGWKNASDADVDVTTLTAAATVYAKWNKAYASSIDMEGLVESEGTGADWQEYLSSHNFGFSTSGVSLDAKASGKTYENWPYQGLKAKEVGAYVEGRINANKLVIIKLGHMAAAANVSLDGVAAGTATGLDAAEPAGQLNYFYVANEAVLRYQTTDGNACVLKAITIRAPYEVSFDANEGDPVAAQYGEPSVTLPLPTKGTENFAGWYTHADEFVGMNGDSYTPTADIELVAHWEALSTVNTLSDLKVDGVTVDGFSADVHTYYIVLPYGTDVASLPKITAATPTNENASVTIYPAAGPEWTDDFGGCYRQQANVTPQDPTAAVGYNDIRITIAPKDGVSIIKVATTGGTNKTVTGLYAGDGDVNLSSSKKMDNGKYIGFTLAGTTLQAGDRINVHTTEAANTGGSHIIFYDNMTDKNELYETGEIGGLGDNIFTINAAMVGQVSAYVYRSNADVAHQWNGYVDFIEVTRAMNPVLTAITFDGVNAEPGVGNTFSALLPNGTNLASMTVTPTIVWNGAGTAAPTAAWAWDTPITFRVTDKDGDYTDYTITLTEDVLKHTVSFNTHGGSAVDAQEVVDGENPVEPIEPTKEDFTFQGWAESDGGAIVDVTSFTITAPKEFHAVWAAETGVIKLLDGEGNINTTDFVTAVSKGTVNFDDADHNCASFGSTASTVVGASGLNKFIIYNAKTDQTKIKFVLYNTNSSTQKLVLQKLAEGGDAVEEIEIDVPSKEEFTTGYYAFNSSLNRTMYAFVKNTNIKVLQVKVVDDGTPVKQFGEVGYSINFNQGRLFLYSGADAAYDGMTYRASSNYAPLTNAGLSITKSRSYSFSVPAAATMTVTASNNAKYYITQTEEGEDNETAVASASSFDLTAGTWYLRVDGSNLSVTNIAFTAPKCAEPAFNALANSDICEGDPYVALNGTATVADAGVPTYQWYKEDNTPIDGATSAEYTPTEDGKYYVIAINHLEGFSDNEKKSELVSVASVASTVINEAPKNVRKDAGEAATLTIDASGKNLHYAWKESDAIDGIYTDVAGAADAPSLDVTVPTGVKYYKVVVSSDCGDPVEAIAKVEKWVELSQVDVTATTEWDWANAGGVQIAPEKNVEILMANIKDGDNVMPNDASFNSQALLFSGQESCVKDGGRWFAKGSYIKFNAAVPGAVFVEFSDNGTNNRRLSINGKLSEPSASKTDIKTFMVNVPVGEVTLMGTNEDGTSGYIRFHKITFVKMDYTREVNSGRYGTICLPNGGKMYGAALYEVAYLDEAAKKIYFDEVLNGEMVAGVPYIFLPNKGIDLLAVAYTDEADAPAGNMNGLYGSYSQQLLAQDGNNYILLNNQYLEVNSDEVYVGANRAYIKKAELPTHGSAPAPGRHRVAMGIGGHNTPTGINQITNDQLPMTNKVIINGQLFILRGEKMYDATGRLVK